MRTFITTAVLLLGIGAGLTGCGSADRREVYHGSNGEPVAAIVAAINGAKRSVLARSPALPRPAVADALTAARARGVLVEFVVCRDPESLPNGDSLPGAEGLPIRFDHSDHPTIGALFVVDARTVVRTSYVGRRGAESVMIIRDTPELGERIAAECRSHIARATHGVQSERDQ